MTGSTLVGLLLSLAITFSIIGFVFGLGFALSHNSVRGLMVAIVSALICVVLIRWLLSTEG